MADTLRLVEFENGPSHGTSERAGWLELIDGEGQRMWCTWIPPIPVETWAALGKAIEPCTR